MAETIWAAKITVDGDITLLTEAPTYQTLSDAVGGYIAPAPCPHGDTVYVNDIGLLVGDAIPNLGAMLLAQHPLLVGDAIICGPLDREGDHKPLSKPAVALLKRLAA